MKYLFKSAKLALAVLPEPAKKMIRALMPLKFKRFLGKGVMQEMISSSDGFVIVKDGRKFKTIEDRLFLRVMFDKEYEPELSSISAKLIDPEDMVIDVGANFGWYATLFAAKATAGKVYAYEPSPRTFENLAANLAFNEMEDRIVSRNVCVGESSGSVTLELGSTSESGLAHVVTQGGATTAEVPMVRIDEDLHELTNQVAYIKVDVEGFEMFALKGAVGLLQGPDQPIIQIELNEEALVRAGCSRQQVTDFLSSLGYEFWEVLPGSSSKVRRCDARLASDVFCFGAGKFGMRRERVV